MTLALYIARRFAASFATVFAGFFAVLFLIDFVEQIRRFAAEDVGLGGAAGLALVNVPGAVYRILPLITILAAVALFLALARSSELVVIRASGRSALRLLLTPILTALAIGIFAVAVLNPIVAGTAKRYDALSRQYRAGEESILSINRAGLWLRQGGPEGQMVIHAEHSSLDGTELFGATFLDFAPGAGPQRRIEATAARLTAGAWLLDGGKEWTFAPGTNPEQAAREFDSLRLPSDLTADRIRDSFGVPAAVPVWELPSFIAALERAGFSARRHQVWLQMELALPLLLAAMVLVGAGFTMRHVRFGHTGLMVLLAICAGFAIFLLRNFTQVLGETGQIPVLVAAWSPPVAACLLALSLLLHLEDG